MTLVVVLDTCVLADALFRDRTRHAIATELLMAMKDNFAKALVPAHAYFELVSVVFAEFHNRKNALSLGQFGKDLPIELEIVPIDLGFIEKHLIATLSDGHRLDASGGDMVFLAPRYNAWVRVHEWDIGMKG